MVTQRERIISPLHSPRIGQPGHLNELNAQNASTLQQQDKAPDAAPPDLNPFDPIKRYMEEARKYPLLKAEQERELSARIIRARIAIVGLQVIYEKGLLPSDRQQRVHHLLTSEKGKLFLPAIDSPRIAHEEQNEEDTDGKEVDIRQKEEESSTFDAYKAWLEPKLEASKDGSLIDVLVDRELQFFHRGIDAHTKLVNSNLRFVVKFAQKFRGLIDLEDAVGYGNEGLMQAAARYDYRKARFTTYAGWWVLQKMTAGIAHENSTIHLPYTLYEAIRVLRRKQSKITLETGQELDLETVAQREGSLDERTKKAIRVGNVASLNVKVGGEEDREEFGNFVPGEGEEQLQTAGERGERREIVAGVLEDLDEKERKFLHRRFGFDGKGGRTLEEVAQEFKIKRESARQIEAKALRKLRHTSRRKLLEQVY